MNVAVIGSGVAGYAAAHALLARGCRVTILDVGERLDARRREAVARLRNPDAEIATHDADLALIGENRTVRSGQLPKKMFFGSEEIYAGPRPFTDTVATVDARAPFPTFTKGGFSNIWGGAVLAADACDMADWPVSRAAMDPFFAAAARLMPLSGGEGTLSRAFPTYVERVGDVDPGPQGDALLADLGRAAGTLDARGVLYGRARLAIYTEDQANGALACNGCGQCFAGCVRGSIFATPPDVEMLVRGGDVTYRDCIFVDRIDDMADKVVVKGFDLDGAAEIELSFDAVFVAGGPINSARLLLKSRDMFDTAIVLKESQKFVLPMLRWRGAPSTIEHPSTTLSSVFLETKVPELSAHWLPAQIVPMNDMILSAAGLPGGNHPAARTLYRPMLRRLMMAWCGMHSDHSSHLDLTLRHAEAGRDRLEITPKVSPDARRAGRIAAKHLFRLGRTFGTLFCTPAIKFSNPGSGTHCGSSFPMNATPSGPLDSDVLGRPFGWRRTFVVDSSVLPSIPGTTLAFTTMANATRIATQAPL